MSPQICVLLHKKIYFVHQNKFCVKYLCKIFPKTVRCLQVELQLSAVRALEMRVRAEAWSFRCLHMSLRTAIHCTTVQFSQGFYTFYSSSSYYPPFCNIHKFPAMSSQSSEIQPVLAVPAMSSHYEPFTSIIIHCRHVKQHYEPRDSKLLAQTGLFMSKQDHTKCM